MELETNKKFNGLDHLRALAIILVFFYHYYLLNDGKPEWLPDVASFGWTGVDLFFVLSGFLISSQIFLNIKLGKPVSLGIFYIKRFFRIIPMYLITVGIYFLIPFFREKPRLTSIWHFLTFTQNIRINQNNLGSFSHVWSLCVEEHFYLFFPLTLLLLQKLKILKRSYLILIILFLLGFAIRNYTYNNYYIPNLELKNAAFYWLKYLYYPTYSRLDGLLIGVSIACMYHFLPVLWLKISKYGNYFLGLSLLVLFFAYHICEDQLSFNASIFGFPIVAIGYGFLLIGAISPSSILFKWKSKTTSLIASLSYGIYLTHKGIIHVTNKTLEDSNLNSDLLLIASIIACFVFAYFLNFIVEKPFFKLRNYILIRYNNFIEVGT